jgi:hypothetical protein
MAALSAVAIVSSERKGKKYRNDWTQDVETLKHKFLHLITIKMVLVIFHYQNNILFFVTVIWQRHPPAASYKFFSAGVSGNKIGYELQKVLLIS